SQMPESLHQEPGRVTAGPRALFEGLLACLDARIQPRHIVNFISDPPIQIHQKADRPLILAGKLAKKSLESRADRIDPAIGFEVLRQFRNVLERIVFNPWFQKEIEGIEGG